MAPRIWKLVVAAFLATIGAAVLAGEPKCSAYVCSDPTWPEMTEAAPAMEMERHVTDAEVSQVVQEHLTRDESPYGDREAIHEHMDTALFAHVDDIEVVP